MKKQKQANEQTKKQISVDNEQPRVRHSQKRRSSWKNSGTPDYKGPG